jgi:organic hydroperoxide reductase OsmC/OhrA
MTDINHMTGKTEKQHFFEVHLNWLEQHRGILYARDVNENLHVATPTAFGGEGKEWSPEHLFLSSLSSCFMSTYLSIAKKVNVQISHFECSVIGQIEAVDGRYKFTHINLYPRVFIAEAGLFEKANLVMEKTQKYCLVSNSVNASIIYHPEVLVDKHPRTTKQDLNPDKTTTHEPAGHQY